MNTPTEKISGFDPSEPLNQQLASLAPCCPWTLSNPAECPLHDLRGKSAKDIGFWLNGFSKEDKEYLLLYHRCCLAVRAETERTASGAPRPPARFPRRSPRKR